FAAHSGELDQALYGGAFVLLLLAATVISYLGVIRSIGDRYRLRIDDEGIAFETGQGWIVLSWQEIRAVGMSYHLARTRKGPHLHMPQLDVFPAEPRLEPWLAERMRDDVPPAPHLGPERYRLRLPVDDTVHAAIEQAVLGYRPDLWVGWYHRRRSGTPWLLR
ncbi:MAG: hypothetical protein HOY71_44065, partial [Nonomuraea sp.]|nr:hypothetical protein [Nonomuraea sp.]